MDARNLTKHDRSFFAGTLSALDVVYLHNDPESVVAVEADIVARTV